MTRHIGSHMNAPPPMQETRAPITDAAAFCLKLYRQDGRMTTSDYVDLVAIARRAEQEQVNP